MTKTVNRQVFVALIAEYGTDLNALPKALRQGAVVFSETIEGQRLLHEERQLNAAFRDALEAEKMALCDKDDDYLVRLLQVPHNHRQQHLNTNDQQAEKIKKERFAHIVGKMLDVEAWFTPSGLLGQAVMVAVVLMVGVIAGMDSLPGDFVEVDLTENLIGETGLYLDSEE